MIDKETAIELARQADATPYTNRYYPDRPFFTCSPEQLEATCNLAVKHAQKDAEPVALDAIYAAWHGAGIDILGGDWTPFVGMLPPLYTHPAYDDTALLRQALEALKHLHHNAFKSGAEMGLALTVAGTAITALRERLGEK